VPLKTEKQLAALASALRPEVARQVSDRSEITLATEGLTIVIDFEAKDTTALRAAVNAYLRWINSMINVLEVAEEK